MVHVPLTVSLGVDGYVERHFPVFVQDPVRYELQGIKRLPALADEQA